MIARLPDLAGEPILLYARPALAAHRGKLLSAHGEQGTPVHAACFIRNREIVLETALLRSPRMLALIIVHEIFHFVWTRLGNGSRERFSDLLASEWENGAAGELGESAALKKCLLGERGYKIENPRLWREYICESFCDTAAWLYAGVERHSSFTLPAKWRKRRKAWFAGVLVTPLEC
ncbi:MAG: hypothetical protein JO211_12955 [Acidobacteriaceae bacterium]|nr:hypothetical protein [Acidobacteriaceae bacterium]